MCALKMSFEADPRLARVEGKLLPVLLSPYLHGSKYSEHIGDFDGLAKTFRILLDHEKRAVICDVDHADDYHPRGVYEISDTFTFSVTDQLDCEVGKRLHDLVEE